MKIVIPLLILLAIVGTVLLYLHNGTKEAKIEAQNQLDSLEMRLNQDNEDNSRDSTQLEFEKEMYHLLFGLGYTKEKAEKIIVEKEDSQYLFSKYYNVDNLRWYNQFKKRYHSK